MSQEELGKFIKFACNQDRIPMVGDREWQHVPPYPMKIAPADRQGDSLKKSWMCLEFWRLRVTTIMAAPATATILEKKLEKRI